MAEKIYTVDELAELCDVDRETIRRWRNRGVRGAFLEATDNAVLRGKPICFTADSVRRFARENPKIMTPALRNALEGDNRDRAQSNTDGLLFSYQSEEHDFLKKVLLEKRASLLKELEHTEKTLAKLEGEN